MTIDITDINLADTSQDRGVLLSEQTQLILLSALSYVENRFVWDVADDTEWDELQAKIAESEKQVLTIESAPIMGVFIGCKVRKNATQSITTAGGENIITWQVVDFDSDGFFDSGVSPTAMVIPSGMSGKYLCMFSGQNNNIAANRTMSIWKNTTQEARVQEVGETLQQSVVSVLLDLDEGDEIFCSMTSSTNSTLQNTANHSAWFSIAYLGQ